MEENYLLSDRREAEDNYLNSSSIKNAKLLMEQDHKRMMEETVKLPQALLDMCTLDRRASNRFKYFGGAVNVIEIAYFLFLPISLLNLFSLTHWLIDYEEKVNGANNLDQWPYAAVLLLGVIHLLALNSLYLRVKYLLLPYLTVYGVLFMMATAILFQSFAMLIGCTKAYHQFGLEEETQLKCGQTKRNRQTIMLSLVILPNMFIYKYFRECYSFISQSQEVEKNVLLSNKK